MNGINVYPGGKIIQAGNHAKWTYGNVAGKLLLETEVEEGDVKLTASRTGDQAEHFTVESTSNGKTATANLPTSSPCAMGTRKPSKVFEKYDRPAMRVPDHGTVGPAVASDLLKW